MYDEEREDEEDNRIVDERLQNEERIPFEEVLRRFGYVRVENRSPAVRRQRSHRTA